MADRGYAAWFLDHNEMLIEIAQDNCFFLARFDGRTVQEQNDLSCVQPARGIEAQIIADTHAPGFDDTPDLAPGLSRYPDAQQRGKGRAFLFASDREGFRGD